MHRRSRSIRIHNPLHDHFPLGNIKEFARATGREVHVLHRLRRYALVLEQLLDFLQSHFRLAGMDDQRVRRIFDFFLMQVYVFLQGGYDVLFRRRPVFHDFAVSAIFREVTHKHAFARCNDDYRAAIKLGSGDELALFDVEREEHVTANGNLVGFRCSIEEIDDIARRSAEGEASRTTFTFANTLFCRREFSPLFCRCRRSRWVRWLHWLPWHQSELGPFMLG